jgi:fibronectin type 3 domain-containing protein
MAPIRRPRSLSRAAVLVQSSLLLAALLPWIAPPAPVLAAGNTALQLNGSSQYASVGSSTSLRSSTFTLEAWFKRAAGGVTQGTGTGGVTAYPLITKGRAEAETAAADVNYFFGIDANGHLAADFEEAQSGVTPSANHPIIGTGTVLATDTGWHHAAATYDGATWNLYLDGSLDATLAVGRPANAATNVVTAIGTSLSTAASPAPLGFFSGTIDEVRIWNVARTQTQIQATKNVEITGPTSGLIGAWNLNEGTGSNLGDSSGNAAVGTAVAAPAWVSGFVVPDSTPPTAPANLTASAAANTGITLNWSANSESDLAGYNVYRATSSPVGTSGAPLNGSIVTSTGYTDSAITAGTTYFYRVVAVDTSANKSPGSNEASATLAGNYALQLNGSSQYARTAGAGLNPSQFTLELWLKRAAGGVLQNTGNGGVDAYPLVTKGRAEGETAAADVNYFFGIDAGGHLTADFEEAQSGATPSDNHPITGTSTISVDGAWHHAAATYDGTTWRLYLDGDLDALLAVGQPANTANTVATAVGSSLNTGGTAAGFFSGTVDEVRIWNVARSLAQIQATRATEITTPMPNLIAAWNANDGIGSGLVDRSGGGNAASTVGSPQWTAGFVAPAYNGAPTVTLVAPADGATGTTTSPSLSVTPTDPEGGNVSVAFYGRAYSSGIFSLIATNNAVVSGSPTSTTWAGRGDGQRYQWYVTVSDGTKTTVSPTWTFNTTPSVDPVIVGGGDIAYCPDASTNTGLLTSPLLDGVAGDIFTLGDNAYLDGTPAEFSACYDPSWGGAPGHELKARTHPAAGNHDWNTAALGGYFGYFGIAAGDPATGRSYYSFDEGSYWHIVVLDSECAKVSGGCAATSPQVNWFRADLVANASRNLIVIWHKPRYSSGPVGDSLIELQPFWDLSYQYGVDLILVGHDHIYERMAPMNASGVADPVNGIRQITAGTGGEEHHNFTTVRSTSVVRNNDAFGVLKLTLHPTTYDWLFLPESGKTFTDSGTSGVNAGPNHAPTISSVTISPTTPTTDDTLTASVNASDPDGDTLTYTYQWSKNSVDIAGATGATLNLATAGNGDRGDAIRVRVTASDGIATTAPTTSAPVTVVNSPPTLSVGLTPTDPSTDDTLTATVSAVSDADNDTVTWSFVWRNGTTVIQTTPAGTNITDTLDLSTAGNGDAGDTVSVEVAPNDGTDLGQSASDSVVVENQAPVMESVTITPTSPTTDQTLTANPVGHDPDGTAVTYVYQWTKNGSDIPGATSATLDLSTAGNGDKGDAITVSVSASDGSASSTPLTATAVTIVNAAPNATVALPSSIGTDGVLTASATKSDADGDTVTLTYVWKVNGGVVRTTSTSATTDSLDLSAAGNGDDGDTVSVEVTPNDGTVDGTPASDSTTVVGTGLAFNGSTQYVTFGQATGLDASTFTLEAWFNWTGGGVGTSTGSGGIASAIPLITKGRAEAETPANVNMNYFLGIDATSHTLVGDFEDTATGGNHPVTGTAVVTANTWHHVAATYDGTTWRLYLDGVLDKSLVVGAFSPEATSIQHAAIGSALTSTGTAAGFFAGTIDEVRIWNVARTGAQMRTTRDDEITGPSAGLLGRWGLNEGSGTTAGNSAGSINGTLAPANAGPTWVTGYGFPQDTTAPAAPAGLTATAGDTTATINWTAGGESDLAGYDLYRSTSSPVPTGGTPLNGADLIRATSFTDTGLVNGTQYFYALVAVDGSNNRSAASQTSGVTPAGNGSPTVVLVVPADGATGTTTSPQLSVTPTDPEGSNMSVTFYGRAYRSGTFGMIATQAAVSSGTSASTIWSARGQGQRYEWYVTVSDGVKVTTSPTWTFNTTQSADPVLVGAGDIAYCPDGSTNTGSLTSPILEGVAGTIFTAGDDAYVNGTALEFANCYDPSWGGAPTHALKARTLLPVLGNHEYGTSGASGYFNYFGAAAGPAGLGYYGYDVPGSNWHVITLNTECAQVGGCVAGSPQETWFRGDLGANSGKNVIVIWHKPRWSSGATNLTELQAFWSDAYNYGVDLVLVGHDHLYERLAPTNTTGGADPTNGVPQITIGTGGEGHHTFGTIRPTSVARNSDTFGVLKLTLHATSFDWTFLPEPGKTFTDSGTQAVHGSPGGAPTISAVSISPSSPNTAQTLTASVTASDPDGDPLTYTYQWTKNGTDIPGATASTLNLATVGNGDRGDAIRVRATASDGVHQSSPATSNPVTVVNASPTATVSLSPTSPTTNQTLTATATKADADGDAVSLTFTWKVDGTVRRTMTTSSALTDTFDLSIASNGDRGQIILVEVTPSDGTVVGGTASSSATVANSAPTIASASIAESTATTNSTLHAVPGATTDADVDPVTTTYQWTRNGIDIAGATSLSLDMSQSGNGDKGDAIRVRITPTDGTTSGTPATSAPLTVANTAPTAGVTLDTSSPDTNATLTATATKADADGGDTVTLTFVWRVNGTVKKTTANSSSLTDTFDLRVAGNGDPGDSITVQVTPSDGAATGASASASATVVGDTSAPAQPGPATFTTTSASIALDWPNNSELDLAGYRVYRGLSATGPFTLLTSTPLATSAYTDTAPVVGAITYKVSAVDTSGNESSGAVNTVSRTIALRATLTAQSTNTSISVPRPSGVGSGDVLIVVIERIGTGTITPPSAGGWTEQKTDVSGTSIRQGVFSHVAAASEPTSYSFGLGSTQGAAALISAYVGVDNTTPVDAASGQSGSTAAINATSVSASANGLLIMAAGIGTSATISPAGGMVERAELAPSGKAKLDVEFADVLLGPAGATGDKTALASKAGANVGQLIALRASGSPPPPPPPATAPGEPQGLAATPSSGKVTLTWSPPASDGGASVTTYKIYRGTSSGAETLLTSVGNVTSYQDTAVANGTRYYYKVAAVNSVGEGPQSAEASATPAAASVPSAPMSLTANARRHSITLSWKAPASNGGSSISGYQIFRSTSSGTEVFLVSVGNVTSYKDTTALSGVTYFYWVEAVNAVGASAASNEAFATAK